MQKPRNIPKLRDNLRGLMLKKNMSFRELAKKSGVGHSTIANITDCNTLTNCSLYTAIQLAKALDVTVDELIN